MIRLPTISLEPSRSAALDMADGFVKAGDAIPTLITAFSGIATLMGTKAGVIMPFYAVGIAA